MLNRFLLFVTLVGAITFVGCAAQNVKSYETSGFLGDYSNFKPGMEGQPNLIYMKPDIDLKKYNKIIIDHVVVYFKPGSKNKEVDPEQLMKLTEYFHRELVDAFRDRYRIVSNPGEGVIRIRTAITDVEPGSPIRGATSTILPVGAVISIIKKKTTGTNTAVGRASIEIELVDSLSEVRLAAAIDRREGGKKVISGKWSAIKDAFSHWAHKLRLWLDKERAR